MGYSHVIGTVSIRQLRIQAPPGKKSCNYDITHTYTDMTLNNGCRRKYSDSRSNEDAYGDLDGNDTMWWYRHSEGTRARQISGDFGSYTGGGFQVCIIIMLLLLFLLVFMIFN